MQEVEIKEASLSRVNGYMHVHFYIILQPL